MAVAKSYQELEIVGDVFVSSGRQYVNVKLKSGKLKTVRWYSDAEYRKMYPEAVAVDRSADPYYKPQKEVLGFTKGYITIFKGDTYSEIDWFRASIARYTRWWGWYIISTEAIPCDLPCGLEPIELKWECVGEEEGMLKPDAVVIAYVNSLLYDAGVSEFQGNIGDRLDLELTVTAAHKGENQYGSYTIHYMEDAVGNQYLWNTGAKSWEVGDKRHIKGTVKDHKVFKNVNTTILTRCTLVK